MQARDEPVRLPGRHVLDDGAGPLRGTSLRSCSTRRCASAAACAAASCGLALVAPGRATGPVGDLLVGGVIVMVLRLSSVGPSLAGLLAKVQAICQSAVACAPGAAIGAIGAGGPNRGWARGFKVVCVYARARRPVLR